MDSIYFEKQEGSLCAQHCLNALLQGQYFTAVDLASHAQELDSLERMRMAESGVDSDEYRQFLQQPSGNMDDSGYFSVQVISSCLKVWNLELIPYNSEDGRMTEAQKNPEKMRAYICNYKDHWLTIRRLAHQWFNLNSLLSGPVLISDTYLACFLAQLQREGYSIFVVIGEFPNSTADVVLKNNPVVESDTTNVKEVKEKKVVKTVPFQGEGYRLGSSSTSGACTSSGVVERLNSVDDEELQRALKLSMSSPDEDDLEKAVAMSLIGTTLATPPEETEDEDIQKALKLSLEQETDRTTEVVNADDIRSKRIAYYNQTTLNT